MSQGNFTQVLRQAADPNCPPLLVYRVQAFDLTDVPPAYYGQFYDGDSYVVLQTIRSSDGGVQRRIFFWQGANSSIDELAGSAIFSKELDDAFGGAPIEFREQQGQESMDFRQLFPQGITYLQGGVASALRAVGQRPTDATKLWQVKSPAPGQAAEAQEVAVALSSLVSNASFLLHDDASESLYLWHGGAAGFREKTKALEVANGIRNDRGDVKFQVLDQDDTSSDEANAFFRLLGAGSAAEGAAAIASA